MIDKIEKYEEVGDVWFKSSSKAKSINITVKPFEPVKVSVPHSLTLLQAETAVENNLDWIKRELSKMEKVEQQFTIFKPNFTYRFQDVVIEFKQAEVDEITVAKESDQNLLVHTPMIKEFSDEQQAFIIEKIVTPKMKQWCKMNVVPRAFELAGKHGIHIPSVTIRKSKTRWGSLGKGNRLNISLYTAKLPQELIDYVILHELAHTKYKDHSKLYWGYLKSLYPNYNQELVRLKSYKIGVI